MARQQDHQLVAPDDLPVLVDHPNAIGIAVVGDPDFGFVLLHRGDQELEVLGDRRIRVVVGEPSIGIAEQLDHVVAHRLQQRDGGDSAHAVARVDHHLHSLAAHLHRRLAEVEVGGDDVEEADVAFAIRLLEVARFDQLAQLLNHLAVERGVPGAHLEAVVLRRVVAAGDHRQPVDRQGVRRVVDARRGDDADVDDVDPGRGRATDEQVVVFRRADPGIAADHDRVAALALDHRRQALPQHLDDVVGEVFVDNTTHVVLAKNLRIHGPGIYHGGTGPRSKRRSVLDLSRTSRICGVLLGPREGPLS